MRGWRLALLIMAGLLAAAVSTVLAVALNVATGGTARWFPTMERYPLWWTAGATAGVAAAGLLVWWAQRWYDRGLAELVPAVQRPEPWVVGRPDEVNQVVAALRRRRAETVGITTAVHGTGGFGKTTVAKIVRADQRVVRRFRGGVYWVTLGRDAGKEALPGLVNDLIKQVDPDRAVTFTTVQQASERLAAILAKGRRRLIILDDVWTSEQLTAFPVAGRCARLITTRVPSLTDGAAFPVRVDQMTGEQARVLLLNGLPPLPSRVESGLLEKTGRWPLLLQLANKTLASQAKLLTDISPAAEDLLRQLREGGALGADDVTGEATRQLDVSDPAQRNKAVRATIEASTSLLTTDEHARLAELAVFAEDETIPLTLITALWQATARTSSLAAGQLVTRLADLALLSLASGGEAVTMHDVIRDYLLRERTGTSRLAQLHRKLLDTVAERLPGAGEITAWWELPERDRYLRDHLIEHLLAAKRMDLAGKLASDLRWVDARLRARGPAGPSADLAMIGTLQAERLRRVLGQAAHLLAPTDLPYSLTDILYSRVAHDPDWGPQAQALALENERPALINNWPLPDLPALALRWTLAGHTGRVRALAVSLDGTWLAAADGKQVQIWDLATGRKRATLTGHTRDVTKVAVAPDGTWLASMDSKQVRIWDLVTGRERGSRRVYIRTMTALAVAPDGTWLATADDPELIRIRYTATGRPLTTLRGTRYVTALAFTPDGTGLAIIDRKYVQVWDLATGRERRHTRLGPGVRVLAVSPDGTRLAIVDHDCLRIWDTATGRERVIPTGSTTHVTGVTAAPDGSWLATAAGKRVQIWDAATGRERAMLTGHTGLVTALAAAPDGSWMATACDDGAVRIWDLAGDHSDATPVEHVPMSAVAFDPHGTWLATVTRSGTAQIWDAATGRARAALADDARAVAVAPDGTWLAIAADKRVRIWEAATGRERATLTGHTSWVTALAAAPDGSLLAAADWDGSVRIWDPANGREHANFIERDPTTLTERKPTPAVIRPESWLEVAPPHGIMAASRRGNRAVHVADGATGLVTGLAVAPDGSWLAAAGRDGSVRIWDLATGRKRATLSSGTGPVAGLAVAPDGSWLAAAGQDGSVRIWDAVTGRKRATLTGHTELVAGLAVAPDASWLAAAGQDGSVRIWDAVTGRKRATLSGHTGPVRAVAVAPDGSWLAAAGRDGSVRIWDLATNGITAIMRVGFPLRACAWSPSGQSLAVGGDAGLYLFTFKPRHQTAATGSPGDSLPLSGV